MLLPAASISFWCHLCPVDSHCGNVAVAVLSASAPEQVAHWPPDCGEETAPGGRAVHSLQRPWEDLPASRGCQREPAPHRSQPRSQTGVRNVFSWFQAFVTVSAALGPRGGRVRIVATLLPQLVREGGPGRVTLFPGGGSSAWRWVQHWVSRLLQKAL